MWLYSCTLQSTVRFTQKVNQFAALLFTLTEHLLSVALHKSYNNSTQMGLSKEITTTMYPEKRTNCTEPKETENFKQNKDCVIGLKPDRNNKIP